jgi:uncharacterized protein Yka (UPF0111/DUF47 family)
MTTATDEKNTQGIKRVFNETVEQVQTRFKDLEKALKTSVEQFQVKIKEAGEDGKKRFDGLKDQLGLEKVETLLEKFTGRATEAVEEVAQFGEDAVEKLGLAKLADFEALTAELATVKKTIADVTKKLETARKRLSEMVPKKELKKLTDRLTALEKTLSK